MMSGLMGLRGLRGLWGLLSSSGLRASMNNFLGWPGATLASVASFWSVMRGVDSSSGADSMGSLLAADGAVVITVHIGNTRMLMRYFDLGGAL